MTQPTPPGPEITVEPVISCSAGVPVTVEAQVWHPGPRPAGITVAIRGLDAEWTPPPVAVGTLAPGESVTVPLELRPGPSALGARYPFVVVAVVTDPLGRGEPVLVSTESTLVIGGREPTVLDLDPSQATAVFSKRVRLTVTNPSLTDRALTVTSTVPAGLSAEFPPGPVDVPAGRTVTLRGKVRVRRPRVFGTVQTHSYAVAARGQGAPVVVTGTLKARPVFRGALVRALVLLAVVALWVGLAVVAIPRISSSVTSQNDAGSATQTPAATTEPGAGGSTDASAGGGDAGTGGGSDGGAGGSGDLSGGAGGSGGSGGGSGGSGGGSDQSAGATEPSAGGETGGGETGSGADNGGESGGTDNGGETGGVQSDTVALRGLITGSDPGGVTVVLGPTSINEAAEHDAEPAPGTDEQTASGLRTARDVIGKVPADAVRVVTVQDPPTITTTTNEDGTFAIAGVRTQGYYLLTLARAGYQTQRFLVNGANLTGAEPMKIAMVAGGGALSGTVTGPDGPIGAATVTITDGHVSVQTSSVSPGAESDPGSWSVTGLSTPGTYLVSVAAQGFGTASTLVTLGAGGTATADLTLQTGVAAVTGLVSGQDALGQLGGLGGISVSITGQSGDVTTTRTATTLTTGPAGRFTLPDLPTPGEYTLTVSGDGYQDQVQTVSLAEGVGSVDVNVSMIRADGAVSGTVSGNPASGDQPAEGGLVGAGLTLTGPSGATKTMSTSDPPGSFRFTGVTPGVYVLSGSMFGRVTSSVTVEVTASGEATADLTLLSSADTELPATAHIQGRVTDSRTGGDLTCDRAIDTSAPCVITASVTVPAIDPNTGRIDPDAPAQTVTAQANPGEPYLLPAADDPDHKGLVPGLYTVNISAPGYEPGSVSVQVPQGATMSAAPVSLVPLSLIAGRLTTRVGTPKDPTCVAVVPAGTTPPDRSAGCVAAADTVNCVVGNDPSIRCGLVQGDGTYQVRGLVHGGYTVVVIPTDPEYIAPQPFSLTVELGSDGRYDPVLDRLGRIAVTVRQPDLDTATLGPAVGAAVVAVVGSATVTAPDTDAKGGTTITTLQPNTYQVRANGTAGTDTADNVFVQLNQTVDVNLVLTQALGAVTGQVVTNDGFSPDPDPVKGARVTITGVVGYIGLAPEYGSVTVTTDGNGCFAVVPTSSTDRLGPSAACPYEINESGALGSIAAGPLIVRPVEVRIEATDQTQAAYTARIGIVGDGTVRSIPVAATTVLPQPSSTENLNLVTLPAAAARTSAATISLLSKSSISGQVSVSENSASLGNLVWGDTAVTGSNQISPGPYVVQAQQQGFTGLPTHGAHISCQLGEACDYVVNPGDPTSAADPRLRLVRNPTFSGSLTVDPVGATISNPTFTVTPLTANLPLIKLTLVGGTTLQWQETGAPVNLVTPGDYSVSVSLAGFEGSTVTFHCDAPVLGTETCALPTDQPLVLRQLSTPTFVVVSSVTGTGSQLPTGAVVQLSGQSIGTVTRSAAGNPIQTTLPPMSSTDPSYQLEVTAPGFRALDPPQDGSVSCRSQSTGQVTNSLRLYPGATTCTVTLRQLGRIAITTVQPVTNGTTLLSSVAISATPATEQGDGTWVPVSGATPWQTTTGTDGKALLIGTAAREGLDPGSYLLTATLAGYVPTSAAPTVVTIDLNNQLTLNQSVTMSLTPSAVTLQVTLQDGSTGVLPAGTVTVSGWSLTGTLINRSCTIPATAPVNCTAAEQAQGTTVDGGSVKFATIPPGLSYTVAYTPSNQRYQRASLTAQVVPGVDPQSVTLPLARRASGQSGTVRNTDGTVVGGAQVSLRQANDPTAVVNDFDGNPLTTTTGANGRFTLNGVPDGLYRLMVDGCGYDRAITDTLTFNSQATPNPSDVTIQVRRSTRDVTVTLTSTAGIDLTGATASIDPDPAQSGDPACTGDAATPPNSAQSNLPVGSGGTVRVPQLPTGQWRVSVNLGDRAPFGAFTTNSFTVTQQDRGTPALPPNTVPAGVPVSFGLSVVQTQLTMTATLPVNTCNPLPANVQLLLTRDPGGPDESERTLTVPVPAGGVATATVLLPPDGYHWTVTADGFTPTTGSGDFTADDHTPTVSLTIGFDAPLAVVAGTVTVNGSSRPDIQITATHTGQDPVHSDGTGTLCVPPATGWTFSIASDTTLVPDVTGVTVTLAGPNKVQFTGYTLQPGVSLTAVPRRPADTADRSVAVSVSPDGGSSIWSDAIVLKPPATSGTAGTLILPAGSYTLTAGASAPFGGNQVAGIDPASIHTATANLPYDAVTLSVTASIAGARSPAQITITPAAGGSPKATTLTDPAVFADIDPGTYTVSATFVDGTTTYTGKLDPVAYAEGASPQVDVPMTGPGP